jgi:hypothetical protein
MPIPLMLLAQANEQDGPLKEIAKGFGDYVERNKSALVPMCLGIAAVVILLIMAQVVRRSTVRRRALLELLEELISANGLTADEAALMASLQKRSTPHNPAMLFVRPSVFDEAVRAELSSAQAGDRRNLQVLVNSLREKLYS